MEHVRIVRLIPEQVRTEGNVCRTTAMIDKCFKKMVHAKIVIHFLELKKMASYAGKIYVMRDKSFSKMENVLSVLSLPEQAFQESNTSIRRCIPTISAQSKKSISNQIEISQNVHMYRIAIIKKNIFF